MDDERHTTQRKFMATLVELILACSVSTSPVVEDTLYRVVMGHASGHTLTVHDVHTQENFTLDKSERAVALAQGLAKAGHPVRLGMVALPYRWVIEEMRLDAESTLDACTQIKLSSELLEQAIKKEGSKTEDQLHRALARYYMPDDPESLEAIDWGARILLVEQVDISRAHDSNTPLPGGIYKLERSAFFEKSDDTREGRQGRAHTSSRTAPPASSHSTLLYREAREQEVTEVAPLEEEPTPETQETPPVTPPPSQTPRYKWWQIRKRLQATRPQADTPDSEREDEAPSSNLSKTPPPASTSDTPPSPSSSSEHEETP